MQPSVRSTYAQVFSKKLSETVKTTVANSFNKQRRDDRDQQSIVVSGLRKSKDDLKQAKKVLNAMGYESGVVKFARLGVPLLTQLMNDGCNKVNRRPLKVQLLTSAVDCRYVVTHSSLLKDIPVFTKVWIDQFLSRDELNKVKILRKQCDDLNKDHLVGLDNRKLFVARSGKLLKKDNNGQLTTFDTNCKSITSDRKTPNSSTSVLDHFQVTSVVK